MNAFKKHLDYLDERVAQDWPACYHDDRTVYSADGTPVAAIDMISTTMDPTGRDIRIKIKYKVWGVAINPQSHSDSSFDIIRDSFLGS